MNLRDRNILEEYDDYFNIDEDWFIFMNDGYCPLDSDGYPVNFLDISLSKKYKIWRYQTYLYKVLLDTIGIKHNDDSSKNKVLLDVGCGRGGGISFYKDYYNFKKLIGVDLNSNHINFAKKYTKEIDFFCSSALDIPLENQSIDIVTTVETSGYYNPFKNFVSEIKRVLKPNGIYIDTDKNVKNDNIFLENGFTKLSFLNIEPNVRMACAITKWTFFKKYPLPFYALYNDEMGFHDIDSCYNITAYIKNK